MFFNKGETNFDFIGKWKIFVGISAAAMVISLVSVCTRGLNFGVDFAGGTEIQIKIVSSSKVDVNQVRQGLSALVLGESSIQEFGEAKDNEFLVRISTSFEDQPQMEEQISTALKQKFPAYESFGFRGTESAYIRFTQAMASETILPELKTISFPQGLAVAGVEAFGKEANHEYVIKFFGITEKIRESLEGTFGKQAVEIKREEMVGPKVGKELRQKGLYAMVLTLLVLLLYIAFRFEMSFAPGAIIALIHDVTIPIGIFSLFQLDFSLQILAALMTIVGYSINDTIVVYDRIRENQKLFKQRELAVVMNTSINQTLNRTILTSLTVLFVTLALLFFGGPILKDMSLALTIGVLSGTYSTVYIASPSVLAFNHFRNKWQHKK